MSFRDDPLRGWIRVRRTIDLLGFVSVLGVGAWAFLPSTYPERDEPPGEGQPASAGETPVLTRSPFPVGAFSRTLWYEPPPPVVAATPKTPEMPRLELVGISAGSDGYRAMIYDQASEELRTVGPDDQFGVTRILAVEAQRVLCEAHGQRFELRLDREQP